MAYVNQRRVLRAKERLLLSGDAIKTIASQVGFSDPLYFTRVFRKLEGLFSPHTASAIAGRGRISRSSIVFCLSSIYRREDGIRIGGEKYPPGARYHYSERIKDNVGRIKGKE